MLNGEEVYRRENIKKLNSFTAANNKEKKKAGTEQTRLKEREKQKRGGEKKRIRKKLQ